MQSLITPPFTREQFLAVFADYNLAMWPIQVFAYLLGVMMIAALPSQSSKKQYIIGSGLAAMWVWAGIAYHGFYFSTINTAAFFFAALFVLQALLLFYASVIGRNLKFSHGGGVSAIFGWGLLIYAMLIYPLVGMWNGHFYPETAMFGITPCPVTIFTVGLLVLAKPPVPRVLLVIPFLWSLMGGSSVFLLGVLQDWPLLFCVFAIPFIVIRDRKFLISKSNRVATSA